MEIQYSDQLESIPMSDNRFENLCFIDIIINEKPIAMMFDTGASMTVLSKSMAERIGVKLQEDKIRAGNSAGQVMEIETAVLTEVRLGNSIIKDIHIIVAPDSYFDFGVDSDGRKFTAYGLLGSDIISQFYWEVDPNSREFRVDTGGKLSGYSNLTWDTFAIVKAIYNNTEVSMGFDSGHTESMLDNTWVNRLVNLRKAADSIIGVGGSIEESVVVADKVNLSIGEASVLLNDVIVLEHAIYGADPEKMSGLLGADVVQGRKWSIDYKSHCFIIE